MTDEQRKQYIDKRVSEIMEVCESVQVSATFKDTDNGATLCYHTGSGNFYARLGSCREFITTQDEYARENARRNANA